MQCYVIMRTNDRIWKLIEKKILREASVEENRELNDLLFEDAETHASMVTILKWWDNDSQEEVKDNSYFLFQKILERIKSIKTAPPRVAGGVLEKFNKGN